MQKLKRHTKVFLLENFIQTNTIYLKKKKCVQKTKVHILTYLNIMHKIKHNIKNKDK